MCVKSHKNERRVVCWRSSLPRSRCAGRNGATGQTATPMCCFGCRLTGFCQIPSVAPCSPTGHSGSEAAAGQEHRSPESGIASFRSFHPEMLQLGVRGQSRRSAGADAARKVKNMHAHANQFTISLGPRISRKRCQGNRVEAEKKVKHFISDFSDSGSLPSIKS